MKIQVLNYDVQENNGTIVYTTLSAPHSLDEYDVNVIDLSNQSIWFNKADNLSSLNCIEDFRSVKQMVMNSHSSVILYVLPQDINYYHHYGPKKGKYEYSHNRMKDVLDAIEKYILTEIIPVQAWSCMLYENTRTIVNNKEYLAAFYFDNTVKVLTSSIKSNKATTIRLFERIIITTLDVTKDTNSLIHFIHSIIPREHSQELPEWVENFGFYDDTLQKESIIQNQEIIDRASQAIEDSKNRLKENNRYKSILCSNGDTLVEVVFEILEKLLDCDLSTFVDKRKEDFCINKSEYTLIGEIKGVTSNVKSEHVSQLEVHYQGYLDKLREEQRTENVHQLLIINPMKNKPVSEREPIHEIQINLAKRNGSLIVETKTLLQMFEKFLQGEFKVEDCERVFLNTTGILEEQQLERSRFRTDAD